VAGTLLLASKFISDAYVLGMRAVKAAGVMPAELQWLELQCFALLRFRLLWDEEQELEPLAEALVLRHEARKLRSLSQTEFQGPYQSKQNPRPAGDEEYDGDGGGDGDEQATKPTKAATSRRNTITFRTRERAVDSSPKIRFRGEAPATSQPTAAFGSHPSPAGPVAGITNAVATATLR
jgi:hypothetical protein